MTLSVGDRFPALTVLTPDESGSPKPLDLNNWLEGKTCVIFGVPGAFTPTCSVKHLPGFVERAAEFKAKGVDQIACHSVNDAFVMAAWSKASGSPMVTMIADGAAEMTKALGLELDLTSAGMGLRCKRYAMIIKLGKIVYFEIEQGQTFGVSSAEAVLEAL